MDIAMPSLDGIEATAVIRENDSLKDVPIICITAYEDRYGEKAKEAGCDLVLSKPLDLAKLKPLVMQYLHH